MTTLPGSAVPVTVSVLSAVMPSPWAPVSVPTDTIAGAAGGVVSTMNAAGPLIGLVLPAASVAWLVKLWLPSANGGVVKFQLPLASTTTLPIGWPLSKMTTVLPGSPLPLIVIVSSAVEPSP